MYAHLGGEVAIPVALVVALIDLEWIKATDTATLAWMKALDDAGRLQTIVGDDPRSLIITVDRAYVSPLRVATLKRRLREGVTEG